MSSLKSFCFSNGVYISFKSWFWNMNRIQSIILFPIYHVWVCYFSLFPCLLLDWFILFHSTSSVSLVGASEFAVCIQNVKCIRLTEIFFNFPPLVLCDILVRHFSTYIIKPRMCHWALFEMVNSFESMKKKEVIWFLYFPFVVIFIYLCKPRCPSGVTSFHLKNF